MVTCPACGKENEDSAYECKRCRAPLREDDPPIEFDPGPESLGEVCRRCEAYNVPGVRVCSNCGAGLFEAAGQQSADKTPPEAFTPPSQTPETISQELRALAISDEEAAEAGLTMGGNGSSLDKTPPDPFAAPGMTPYVLSIHSQLAFGPASPNATPKPFQAFSRRFLLQPWA